MAPELAVERMRDLVGTVLDPAVHRALRVGGDPAAGAGLPRRRARLIGRAADGAGASRGPARRRRPDDGPAGRAASSRDERLHRGRARGRHRARGARRRSSEADVVLLDHQLPDASGLEVLDAIRARPHPPAVIMVTAHGNESLAADGAPPRRGRLPGQGRRPSASCCPRSWSGSAGPASCARRWSPRSATWCGPSGSPPSAR